MGILKNVNPQRVFAYFEELSAIPHGSGNTKAISDYCVAFAKSHGLSYRQDAMNNVVIRKPAAPGYETHPAVILQGHLDMVCEKEPDSDFDFAADPLRLRVDGDWLCADGTTLGGDDGIAVAMVLAILEDAQLPHPPLEAVFTVDEEIGLLGAAGLDAGDLQGRILLNIDSEDEGVLTVGCAGGARMDVTLPLTRRAVDMPCYEITVAGLIGGHSGVEINKGRQNAHILLGRLLAALPFDWRLVDITGGQKDNAIPRQAVCVIAAAGDPTSMAADFVAANRVDTDPSLMVTVKPVAAVPLAVDADDSQKAATFLANARYGVQAMSSQLEGLVETSLNLGVLYSTEDALNIGFSVRSAINRSKEELLTDLRHAADAIGATCEESGHYPAWEYTADSPLQRVMIRVFEERYGKKPVVVAIHAGLECGLFSEKLPGMDAVSFGPDMQDIHTSRERLSIPSVERTYTYLLDVLKAL